MEIKKISDIKKGVQTECPFLCEQIPIVIGIWNFKRL